jgi:hypothetical protein
MLDNGTGLWLRRLRVRFPFPTPDFPAVRLPLIFSFG